MEILIKMVVPTRRDQAIKNVMKLRKKKINDRYKNIKEEKKELNPEDFKRLLKLWKKLIESIL